MTTSDVEVLLIIPSYAYIYRVFRYNEKDFKQIQTLGIKPVSAFIMLGSVVQVHP